MKIKAGEIRFIHEGLKEILQIELPVKPAYWLARFLTKLNQETESFEKARLNLAIKHAKKDKEGKALYKKDKDGKQLNEYDVPDIEAFNKEFLLLAEEEFEIDFKPIKLDDLGDIKLKPVILAKLEKIIEI